MKALTSEERVMLILLWESVREIILACLAQQLSQERPRIPETLTFDFRKHFTNLMHLVLI